MDELGLTGARANSVENAEVLGMVTGTSDTSCLFTAFEIQFFTKLNGLSLYFFI